MRILVITQYFYPEDFRINDICKELVKRGNEVTVLTGLPNYPSGSIFSGYEKAYKKTEDYNGIKIIRCKNRPRKKGSLNLLLNYLSFSKKATKIAKRIGDQFDVIYGYQLSPITSMKPAVECKKRFKKPLYLYVCDIWPESMRDRGAKRPLSKKNILYLFAKRVSTRIYNQADIIGTKCEEFIDYLCSVCKVDKNKCFVNYEHAEEDYLNAVDNSSGDDTINFLFAGNIGESSNCELIIKSASRINGNYKIHFVGDGSKLDNVKCMTKKLGLESNVLFYGRHPRSEMVRFYNNADVCLLTLSSQTDIGLTPPAKLSSYMASGKPILASVCGAARRIILESNCGFVCNDDEFYEKMQKIIDCPSCLNGLGKNGRQFFLEHFTLKKHVDTLEEILLSLI